LKSLFTTSPARHARRRIEEILAGFLLSFLSEFGLWAVVGKIHLGMQEPALVYHLFAQYPFEQHFACGLSA
jgi:hypothetical protein